MFSVAPDGAFGVRYIMSSLTRLALIGGYGQIHVI